MSKEELEKEQPQLFPPLDPRQMCEALLFSSREPLTTERLRELVAPYQKLDLTQVSQILGELKEHYRNGHSFQLDEIGGGYLLRTKKEFSPLLRELTGQSRPERLSLAAHETLAIVAWKEPITRAEIDSIRGVDSSGTLQWLLERELIYIKGRKDTWGRPSIYATTPKFLELYGLKTLAELETVAKSLGPKPQMASAASEA